MSIKNFKKTSDYKCQQCGITEWNNQPICLEIDHINGDNQDNQSSNLRYLCPNCHSQTKTWRGRNKNTGFKTVSDEELLESIKTSKNIRQALIKVGLTPKGLNYNRVSKLLNQTNSQHKNSQSGTIWINNGIANKKVKLDELEDYLKSGYQKGRLMLNFSPPKQNGKIWVTNGIDCKLVHKDQVPKGYWKGRFQSK